MTSAEHHAAAFHWPFSEPITWRQLPAAFYRDATPTPVASPTLLVWNAPLADQLALPLDGIPKSVRAAWFAGNDLPDACRPLAQAYAGHQFGGFTRLGDGRAHLLAEHVTPDGQRVDIQLKGSGRTPFSRGGDGRAALGPMLREFIISEAMAHLGIPTSRGLAVVATGERVYRERPLPGAVLTRIAASHLRIGTFEHAARLGDPEQVSELLNYAIARHDPDLPENAHPARAFLERVAERQIRLVALWMGVGFIHGVMNTDNTFISGETLDYGPCAFLDEYVPNKVFSSIDRHGRYGFSNQKAIILWNLARLAETLLPLLDPDPQAALQWARSALKRWDQAMHEAWLARMRAKLGLEGEEAGDENLIGTLLDWMHRYEADYTLTFRALADDTAEQLPQASHPPVRDWITRWRERLAAGGPVLPERFEAMQRLNPVRIPRNHQVERVLAAAEAGDLKPLGQFLDALQAPFTRKPEWAEWDAPPAPEARVLRTFCGT